jgi:methionine-rich copper-binding protein CopC
MHTQMIRGWVVGVLAVLSLLLGVSPAGAHAELESSDPQDGATLTSAPEAITFVFGEEILPQGNAVTLTDVAADVRLEVGLVDVDGDTVSVTWPESSPAGQFRAAFRVVSADGHPINGTITFTVEQAVGAVQASPAAVVASPSAGAASPVPVSQGPSAPAASPSAPAATPVPAADDADAGLLTWVLGIGLAVLIGAVAGTWVMRRTR